MLNVEQLESKLNTKNLAGVYLLFGEEKFLIENSLKKIKKNFGETIKGINYILIDEENIKNIISDIEIPAFGYEKKLIIVNNLGILKKDGKRKNSQIDIVRENLNDYITNNINIINENVVLVFIEDSVDSRLKLYKTIEKNGTVCKFDIQSVAQLEKRIKAICNAYKVNIDLQTTKYFVEVCGTKLQDLINEIRKLIEYVGENGTITKEAIDKLSIKQIESVIFDLTDSIGKRDVKTSLNVLNNLIYEKEPIQKILVTIYNHFKRLYMVKLAIKYNKDIISSLKLQANQRFLVNKYKTQASFFNEKELKNILDKLIDLEYKYKNGLIDVNVGLEAILCTYF